MQGADWIQESVPEDLELKRKLIADIQEFAPADVIIGSSTSGFKPTELQLGARNPGTILVAHPFNPVYLLPLVEVVANTAVSESVTERAMSTISDIGMQPLLVRNEIDAHIADRMLEAAWREALWLVADDVATTEEIDDAIRFGFGLAVGADGLVRNVPTCRRRGGYGAFHSPVRPYLALALVELTDVPELTDALVQKIASQCDAQSGSQSIA